MKWVLVTGAPHGGTRLAVEMLARHPEFSVPMNVLNSVKEYGPLHKYFIKCLDETPYRSNDYVFYYEQFCSLRDEYQSFMNHEPKKFGVIKMPFYPLLNLDQVTKALGDPILIYATRKPEAIVASHVRRGEDVRYFGFQNRNRRHHLKKLPWPEREKFKGAVPGILIHKQVKHTIALKRKHEEAGKEFHIIDFDSLTERGEGIRRLLNKIGADDRYLPDLMSAVNFNRLKR